MFSKIERAVKIKMCGNNRNFKVERIIRPYGYDLSQAFISFVNNIVEKQKSDVIQVEFYPYLGLIEFLPRDIKRVFIHHEIRYIRDKRMMNNLSPTQSELKILARLKQEEINLLNKYDIIVTLTDIDKAILSNDGVTTRIVSSPAAVNTEVRQYNGWNKNVVFIGGAGHAPNVEGVKWLCDNVFPNIDWERFKDISIAIIGGGWNEDMFYNIPKHNLKVMGFVPDLAAAVYGGILMVPIISGSGMRMKILDGAALSMPIITTSTGVEGLDFMDGESCLIANSGKEFAKGLMKLIRDENLRQQLANNANTVFVEKYSKETLANIRNNIYKI